MPDAVLRIPLEVTAITERGVRVVTPTAPDQPFWLPRSVQVAWDPAPKVDAVTVATIPHWLAQKHKQLVRLREVASECVRHANTREKEIEMSMQDKPEDAGTGALFKNDKKEKPTHPDYRGDCLIKGRKYWVSAWIKTSEKSGQKFMSLAFREADQPGDISKPKPKPAPVIDDDLEIPF